MLRRVMLVLGCAAILSYQVHGLDDQDDPKVLSATFEMMIGNQLKAMQAESTEAVFADVDADSWDVDRRKMILTQVFELYDIEYSLTRFRLLDRGPKWAVVRYRQEMTKVAGPPLTDNAIDMLQVFRKDGQRWKMYEQLILNTIPVPASEQDTEQAPSTQPVEQSGDSGSTTEIPSKTGE